MRESVSHIAAFRIDAGPAIGGGHLMRCLALAERLRTRSWDSSFYVRSISPGMRDLILGAGFEVHELKAPDSGVETPDAEMDDASAFVAALQGRDVGWVVVDHYDLGARWESLVKEAVPRILVIDDLGREHACDLLLDHNYHVNPVERYEGAVRSGCKPLLGPRYALLRPQFSQRPALVRSGGVGRLFVSFGATDPTSETQKVLECLLGLPEGLVQADVLVDSDRLDKATLSAAYERGDIRIRGWVDEVAALMADADLAIGNGGGSAWERCKMGLPALVVVVADNQRPSMEALARQGAIRLLGESNTVTSADICKALRDCLEHPDEVTRMSNCALELMPVGVDGPSEVATAMEALS